MSQATQKIPGRKVWLLVVILLLVAAGAGLSVWYLQSQTSGKSAFETSPAKLGTLTAGIGASGTIRAGRSATLAWNSNGRVQSVTAQLGDQVKVNQVLATLSRDSLPRNVILAEADLVSAQQNLDTLLKSDINLARAMQNLANAKQTVKDAQDDYDFLTRKRISQEIIDDTADQIEAARNQLARLEYFYNLFYAHRAEGSSDKAGMIIQLTNARENINNLVAKYNWYTSKASPLEIDKSLASLNLAIARQADAQRAFERVKNGTNPDDIAAAQAKVAAAQATLNLAKITAPFDGTITQSLPQAGDRISANQTAFQLDDLSTLMVDLQISEVDINNVGVGQEVTITLEAVSGKTYHGIVSRVNQATKAGQGGVNFLVSVTFQDADDLVKPGMSADVNITTRQVSDALLIPNSAIRMLAGQRIVYILKNDQPVQVNIRLGSSADNESQVVGGELKAGDIIILNPPAQPTPIPIAQP